MSIPAPTITATTDDPWTALAALEAEQSAHPARLRAAATRGDTDEARRLLDRAAILPTLIEMARDNIHAAQLADWREGGKDIERRLKDAIAEQTARSADVDRLARELQTARQLLDGQVYEVRSLQEEQRSHSLRRPRKEGGA